MTTDSAIRWTDGALPVVTGCSYEGPGCRGCYAPRWAWRFSHHPNDRLAGRYLGTVRKTETGHIVWTGQVRFNADVLLGLLTASHRKPMRWFISRDGDLFHDAVTDEQIAQVLAAAVLRPDHQLILLTKRSARAARFLLAPETPELVRRATRQLLDTVPERVRSRLLTRSRLDGSGPLDIQPFPLANVVVGFSAEDQKRFDLRWTDFSAIAKAGWQIVTSLEPLIRPVRLPADYLALGRQAWIIVGGESGTTARPLHPAWPRSLQEQCVPHGVLFFFKQWGAHQVVEPARATRTRVLAGIDADTLADYAEHCVVVWPDGRSVIPNRCAPWWEAEQFGDEGTTVRPDDAAVLMRRVSVAAAGFLIDGQDWAQSPAMPGAV